MIGSRKRSYIEDTGEKKVLMIRRLRCEPCKRVHHELPDKVVPYKRHCSKSIEAVVSGDIDLDVYADGSTIRLWQQWFCSLTNHFAGCLKSIAIRYMGDTAEGKSDLPGSPLQRIWQHVGDAPGWLARVVRSVVNANFWVHTRSEYMSG